MEYTVIVGRDYIQISEDKVVPARRFYRGKFTYYYIKGNLTSRREPAIAAMMSHAYGQGESLINIVKWESDK